MFLKTLINSIGQLVLTCFFFCLLTSCNKDGCDDSCLNGICVEGVCECLPGFEGPSCDQEAIDFSGFYKAVTFTYSNCENAQFNNVEFVNGAFQFCRLKGSDPYCLEVSLQVFIDHRYDIVFLDRFSDGRIIPDIATGTYTTSGMDITFCPTTSGGPCETMTIDGDLNNLTWKREGSTCQSTYRFRRFL